MLNQFKRPQLVLATIILLLNINTVAFSIITAFSLTIIYQFTSSLEEHRIFNTKIKIIYLAIFFSLMCNFLGNNILLSIGDSLAKLVIAYESFNLIRLLNIYFCQFVDQNDESLDKQLSTSNKNVCSLNIVSILLKMIPLFAIFLNLDILIKLGSIIINPQVLITFNLLHLLIIWSMIRPFRYLYVALKNKHEESEL